MGPSNTTLNSLLQMLPAQALGLDANSPVGQQASQMLVQMLKNYIIEPMTGISSTDPLWNATLYSNMTNFGITMQNMNTAANVQGMSNMLQMQASARYQFFEGLNRTAFSRDAFDKMSLEQRGGWTNYDAFIEHKTQGMMDNKLMSMLMMNGIWDPTGKMMASYNLKEASSNIARTSMWRGEKNWADKADAVGQMFLNDKYELDYNKLDYGGMSLNETTALVAALTENLNFAPGGGPDGIKQATEKLRERVKDMTNAMAPLKDLFGDDVPKMIRFLEDLSGRDLRQLDSSTVAKLSRNTMNDIMTGAYTAAQIQDMTTKLEAGMSQMNVPYQIAGGAGALAGQILAATNYGFTPSMMTKSQYERAVTDRSVRQAASPYANNMNLAYAVWQSRQGTNDSSTEEFTRQYEALIAGGMTAERAMLEMSGSTSIHQMAQRGYALSGYNTAVTAGLGARAAGARSVESRLRAFRRGRNGAERAGVDEILDWMRNNQDETLEDFVRRINERDADDGTRMALTRIQQEGRYEALRTDFFKFGEQRDVDVKRRNAERVRQRSEFREKLFGAAMDHPSDAGELLVRMLTGGANQGFDTEELKQRFQGIPDIEDWMEKAGLTEQDLSNIKAVSEATMAGETSKMTDVERNKKNIDVMKKYIEDFDTDPRRKEYLQRFVDAYKETGSAEDAQILRTANSMTTDALAEFFSKDNKNETLSGVIRGALVNFNNKNEKATSMYNTIKNAVGEDGRIDRSKLKGVTAPEAMEAIWSDYKEHQKDADYSEQFQAHLKDFLDKGPKTGSADEFINDAIREVRIYQMLDAKDDSKESQTIKHAKSLLSNILGDEKSANDLVRQYSTDVVIGGMSEEKWKENAIKTGGAKVAENWERIQEQLGVVAKTVAGAPDVVQPEKKSLEDIMAELANPDGVLGKLSTAVDNLLGFLNGQGAGKGNENGHLKQAGETEKKGGG